MYCCCCRCILHLQQYSRRLNLFFFVLFFPVFLSFCLFIFLYQFLFCFSPNFVFCFGIIKIIMFMFTYFVHNIPLLHDPVGSVPTFFPSVFAPIMGPCIGLTIMCFILRLRWGRFLNYRSWGVKTWTESKMLEIAHHFP